MLYLIDGYNLLHAMGALHGRVGPDGLNKARLALLGHVAAVLGDEASDVTVVFDAAGAPPGGFEHETYHGIDVRYAIKHAQADDLIEELIRGASAPRHLTVVSNDHRLQRAARQRGCTPLGCLDYLDELERRRQRRQHPAQTDAAPEKKQSLSETETQAWLQEFADLKDDPLIQQLADLQRPEHDADKN